MDFSCIACVQTHSLAHGLPTGLRLLLLFLCDLQLCIILHCKPFLDTGITLVLHFTGIDVGLTVSCEHTQHRHCVSEHKDLHTHIEPPLGLVGNHL